MSQARPDQGSTFIDLILLGLQRWPERQAIVDQSLTLTYRELEQRIYRFARALRKAGLSRGQGLAQLSANRVDTFVTMSAALLLGARYTPLHPLGALDDQLFILDDCDANVLVIDVPYFEERGEELAGKSGIGAVLSLGAASFGFNLPAAAENLDCSAMAPVPTVDDIAWLTYTGGTTGTPKGVMLSHGAMAVKSLISAAEWQWPEEIRYLASSPISHAAGFLLIPTFLKGGTVYLIPGFDPDTVLDLVEKERVNTLFCVPTMLYMLMDYPRTREADISAIETIIYASAPMSPTRLQEGLDLFGPVFFQAYGQTECIHLTALRKEDHRPELLASCGKPPAGIRMVLLDDHCEEVPAGEIGEVCVRGLPVMSGYWRQREETGKTLAGGWLHTGDLAYCNDEGFYFLVDRVKDMIISGGFNVYPREVEDVLTTHPAVAACAVIGVPDEKWGELVTAVIELRSDQNATSDELKALVKERKGSIHAPKQIDFVEEIPRTPLGKADKKALRQRYWGDTERMIN
jgi:fatty-acyl-CoA synthase